MAPNTSEPAVAIRPEGVPTESEPARARPYLRVTAAMKIDGTIDEAKLRERADGFILSSAICATMIRETDQHTGSLNVQVRIAKEPVAGRRQAGNITAELQSPTSERAKQCLTETMNSWLIDDVGEGSAMLLVVIVDP